MSQSLDRRKFLQTGAWHGSLAFGRLLPKLIPLISHHPISVNQNGSLKRLPYALTSEKWSEISTLCMKR